MGAFMDFERRIAELERTLIAVVAAATGVGSGNRRVLHVPRAIVEDIDDLVLETSVDFESDCVKYRIINRPKVIDAAAKVAGTDMVVANGG